MQCASFSKICEVMIVCFLNVEILAASLETGAFRNSEIAVSFEISDENGNLICKPKISFSTFFSVPYNIRITAALHDCNAA